MSILHVHTVKEPESLERAVLDEECRTAHLKPNAHARIVWQDVQKKQKTPYALVYLHGFTANHIEGYPVHLSIARQFGMNLYLSRLEGHGVKADAFKTLTADKLLKSAEKALQRGRQIGKKVILMGTSAGGTLALYLAAKYPDIAGLILYAPLIDFYDVRARLVKKRWINKTLDSLSVGSLFLESRDAIDPNEKIWYARYPLQGVLALAELVEAEMTDRTFKQISQPVFTGYYYKNENNQDEVVSIAAIREMLKALQTRGYQKIDVAFPDADSHVICSTVSSQSVDEVFGKTARFLSDIVIDGA